MSDNLSEALKLLALAGPEGSRPLSRLERGKPVAPGRDAVLKSSLDPLVQSALFLYFDCFVESHNIAQDHEGTVGNWLHAIAHRREPDAWNSKYWYARVKIPPKVSQEIAQGALKVLETDPSQELAALRKKLVNSGEWEPETFVELCDKARKEDPKKLTYKTLAQIQEIEWRALLEFAAGNKKTPSR